jgi:cytochrome d ubiquinol oxidase subunit I
MTLDPVLLSRLQWAWVIAWHILLPAFTVGLASYIAVLEGLYFLTGREIWFRISGFWTRIFAVSFGMGVVSGIIMPFQFGTNWSRFTDAAADVISPLLSYEGLMAFFLEASFLGVLLFGRRLVPAWAHFFAAAMVAFGTLLSSFWILATNSWMQTPQGYKMVDGRFEPVDWVAIIFNPSFPYRLTHNVNAFYITTAFVVMGVGAWLLRRGRATEDARMMIRMALGLLILLVPLQIFLGDQHGLNTLEYQPAKLAAIEGRYDTVQPTPLTLFGIPDDAAATMRDANRHHQCFLPHTPHWSFGPSGAENEACPGIGAEELVRHLSLGYLVERLTSAVKWNDIVDVHILHRCDCVAHVVFLVGCKVEAADDCVNFVHARRCLGVLDRRLA